MSRRWTTVLRGACSQHPSLWLGAQKSPSERLARAATLVVGLLLALVGAAVQPALAGPGHDHGEAPAPAAGNGPRRLPDGSVFLPKEAQRQYGLRTVLAETGAWPRSLELNGRVVMDPNAGGRVQAMVAGRLTPGPGGLPYAGQRVRQGQVLAYVTPEVGGQNRSLNESRLRRLRELADTVPRKAIEEAEAAVANERLVAPVSGVIALANGVAGQVVEAREILFEVVDPERLLVEALAYDPGLGANVAGASLGVGDDSVPLQLLGAARRLRDEALPLTFRARGAALSALAVGQPVKVVVQTRENIPGIALPAASLLKNPANQTIVWVKQGAEQFVPRVVTHVPLDGARVAVTSGLAAGERVVLQAAGLVNQVR